MSALAAAAPAAADLLTVRDLTVSFAAEGRERRDEAHEGQLGQL